jgi:neutral ceramidase
MLRTTLLSGALLILLVVLGSGCDSGWPELEEGPLQAGASGDYLDLPVGIPLGGYTGRDRALGFEAGPDTRDSDYRTDFVPSAGWQTRIPVDVLWLENGDQDAILVRIDLIYSFDELTEAIGAELSVRTGRDLSDSVFTFTNHSHSSYGAFTKAIMLFFGGDFFREEVFDRIVQTAVNTAMAAHDRLEPAAIGLGVLEGFDPEHAIFRDRRGVNDELLSPQGDPTGQGYKDDRITMLRVDSTAGDPIAALFALGIHGTVMGSDSHLISTEAPGHITELLKKRHEGPLWMFAQGAGGDVSPAGQHSGFARMEWIAEAASERILGLYDSIELTSAPILLDPVQRYVTQGRDIKVTRGGSVDLHYKEWDPVWAEVPYYPDYKIWDDAGNILSPLDEFWPQYGAALCGEADLSIPMFSIQVDLPAYSSCLDFDKGFTLFQVAFQSYFEDRDDYPLPLPESRTALLGSLGLSGLPVTRPDFGTTIEDVVIAFAPGEATTLWTQQLRHSSAVQQDVGEMMVIGYAMDHEGYLLTVDDWLLAGYEPSITWWGPLQGEYLLEQLVEVAGLAASPFKEDPAHPEYPTESWYPDWETPQVTPDTTPEAGTLADPLPDYVFTRDGVQPTSASPATQLRRLQDIARWTFFGNDPAMGLPRVSLQREDQDGQWADVLTASGQPVSDVFADIIMTYTPNPLRGTAEDPDPVRTHLYHAEWQATETSADLEEAAGLPLGNYRLQASGLSRDPSDDDYPYDGIVWEASSAPFEVIPAELIVEGTASADGLTADVLVSYAGSSRNFRNVDLAFAPNVLMPLAERDIAVSPGVIDVRATTGSATSLSLTSKAGGPWSGAVDFEITDGFGNSASLTVNFP